jgi:hypothetical protein
MVVVVVVVVVDVGLPLSHLSCIQEVAVCSEPCNATTTVGMRDRTFGFHRRIATRCLGPAKTFSESTNSNCELIDASILQAYRGIIPVFDSQIPPLAPRIGI